jgi:hypothetical protein
LALSLSDITKLDFFFWGFVKDTVFRPEGPKDGSVLELREKINSAVASVTSQLLEKDMA